MIVTINGVEADVIGDTASPSIQNNKLNDISTRNLPSANIRFPRTAKNESIFEYLGDLGSTSEFPYRLNDIVIRDGSEVVLKGKIKITKVTDSMYIGMAKGEGAVLFDLIKDKKLSDLDFSDINHKSNVQTFTDNFNTNDGFIYASADYGGGMDVPLNVNRQSPSLFKHYLWSKIWAEAGVEFSGDFFNDLEYKKEIISMSKGHIDTGLMLQMGDYVTQSGAIPITNIGVNASYSNTLIPDRYSDDRVTVDEEGGLTITEKCKIKLTTSFTSEVKHSLPLYYGFDGLDSTFSITRNGEPVTIFPQIVTSTVGSTTSGVYSIYNTLNVDESIFAEKGDVIRFNIDSDYSAYLEGVSPNDILTIIHKFTNTKVEIIEPYIDFNDLIGDISQTDFIKEIIKSYGLMFNVSKEGVYDFKTMQSILSDKAGAEDWTSKLSEGVSINPSIGKYGIINSFRYNYNENSEKFLDYEHVSTNGMYDRNKTIIESKYNIAEMGAVESFASRSILTIPLYKEEDTYFSVESVKNVTSKVRPELIVNTIGLFDNDEATGNVNGGTIMYNVSNDNVGWEYYVNKYYREFLAIIDKPETITCNVFLSSYDVANIDFFKLKYFSQLGAYYYLNKVHKYKEGKLTKCELIKVPHGELPTVSNVLPSRND